MTELFYAYLRLAKVILRKRHAEFAIKWQRFVSRIFTSLDDGPEWRLRFVIAWMPWVFGMVHWFGPKLEFGPTVDWPDLIKDDKNVVLSPDAVSLIPDGPLVLRDGKVFAVRGLPDYFRRPHARI